MQKKIYAVLIRKNKQKVILNKRSWLKSKKMEKVNKVVNAVKRMYKSQ